jgi:hypothetical protein
VESWMEPPASLTTRTLSTLKLCGFLGHTCRWGAGEGPGEGGGQGVELNLVQLCGGSRLGAAARGAGLLRRPPHPRAAARWPPARLGKGHRLATPRPATPRLLPAHLDARLCDEGRQHVFVAVDLAAHGALEPLGHLRARPCSGVASGDGQRARQARRMQGPGGAGRRVLGASWLECCSGPWVCRAWRQRLALRCARWRARVGVELLLSPISVSRSSPCPDSGCASLAPAPGARRRSSSWDRPVQ